jgi:hypothetical protein
LRIDQHASALHARLEYVPVRALDGAAADGQSFLAQQTVVHAPLVVAVVPDEVVERLQRFCPVAAALLHLRDALHQLRDDGVWPFGEQRLGASLRGVRPLR